jgi:protoporphyrin/coproporphyrin ferrochelatase
MKYTNSDNFDHGHSPRIGVLITNLGTPAAADTKTVRSYLKEFLSDPRVVEMPRLLWWLILNGVILRIRPRRSAAAYAKIWTGDGSPLLQHTLAQTNALQRVMSQQLGEQVIVDFAMRYGEPTISGAIQGLLDRGVRKLLVLPLYPQYSCATTASTFDALAQDFSSRRWLPELRFISHYHDYPPYIEALASTVRKYWQQHGQAERIIFSYHGEPQSYLDNGDPYHCECLKTSRLLAAALGLAEGQYLSTFQSRFGRQAWLKPYTDEVLKELPAQGVKSVQLLCPGFSADCLETLEEIDEENREYFIQAGGERFEYIPCLNSQPEHIDALAQLITSQLSGWALADDKPLERKALAMAHGAKA